MLPFDEAGGGPPVVLLHAGIADRTMWSEHLEPLAVAAVIDTWTLPDAPKPLRDRIATMQRRAYELQKDARDATEAQDPVADLEALRKLELPTLVVAGEHDMPDFLQSAEEMARTIPGARHEVIAGAGHLAPLETPDAFRQLVVEFLGERDA